MADGPSEDPGPDAPVGHGRRLDPDDHDERHELVMASLLDRDLGNAERSLAEALARACSACAVLLGDLGVLVGAARELAAVSRPRDFRLTAEDAARLRSTGTAPGEPHAAATRLTGEMQVSDSDHAGHDQLLVVSLLDRSPEGDARRRAEAFVASCDACAVLHGDLVALRDATRTLPTPRRTRDFTIAPDVAGRLGRTSWRRLIAAFGSTRDAFSRPLAIGLTTIGLAGLLVATIPSVLPAGSSSAALPTLGQAVGGAGANSQSLEGPKEAPAASAAPSAPGPAAAALTAPSTPPAGPAAAPAPSAEPAPTGEAFDTVVGAPASAGAAAAVPAPDGSATREGAERTAIRSIDSGVTMPADRLAVLALASLLVVAGVGLFALRWAGRRV